MEATSMLHRRQLIKTGSLTALWAKGRSAFANDARYQLDQTIDVGVASGDPRADSVIVWTRVPFWAQPLDGYGDVDVRLEVALSAEFKASSIVYSEDIGTGKHADYTVKHKVIGLTPDTRYFYRFSTTTGYVSVIGRTHTTPETGSRPIRFAVLSCQHFNHGFYTAYQNILNDDNVDFIVHLGDFIYEEPSPKIVKIIRDDILLKNTLNAIALDEYRDRYKLYLSDVNLRQVRQMFPFIHIWDDHEFFDNYNGFDSFSTESARALNAAQAYREYIPIDEIPDASSPFGYNIHRQFKIGDSLELFALDTRQHRNLQLATKTAPTMIGDKQKTWLKESLAESSATWKMVLNSVMFQPFKLASWKELGDSKTNQAIRDFLMKIPLPHVKERGIYLNYDAWDGFLKERLEITHHIHNESISNVMFLTGDVHNNFIANIHLDPEDYKTPAVASEIVGTSISSYTLGRGLPIAKSLTGGTIEKVLKKANPHMHYCNMLYNGYFVLEVTDDNVKGNLFKVDVEKPAATQGLLQKMGLAQNSTSLHF